MKKCPLNDEWQYILLSYAILTTVILIAVLIILWPLPEIVDFFGALVGAAVGGVISLTIMYFTNEAGRKNVEMTIETEKILQRILMYEDKLERLKNQKGLLLTLINDLQENDFTASSYSAYIKANGITEETEIDARKIEFIKYNFDSWHLLRQNFYCYNLEQSKTIENAYKGMMGFNNTVYFTKKEVDGLRDNIEKSVNILKAEIKKIDIKIDSTKEELESTKEELRSRLQ